MRSERAVMPAGELRYGLVVASDLENFSKMGILEQAAAQRKLAQILDGAAAAAGLPRADWYRQHRGDGELAVLPADTDAAWVIATFTDQLAQRLERPDNGLRLRVRLAMHHGTFTAGDLGPVGSAPITACRLLDAKPTKVALANSRQNLVLVISRQLHEDVVRTEFHGLRPARFRPVRARIKHVVYTGYLCEGTPLDTNDRTGRVHTIGTR